MSLNQFGYHRKQEMLEGLEQVHAWNSSSEMTENNQVSNARTGFPEKKTTLSSAVSLLPLFVCVCFTNLIYQPNWAFHPLRPMLSLALQ